MSFDVATDNRIRNLRVDISLGLDTCTITVKEIVIGTDGSFTFYEELRPTSGKAIEVNRISGKFESATTLVGTLGSRWLCGSTMSMSLNEKETTWRAEWKGP